MNIDILSHKILSTNKEGKDIEIKENTLDSNINSDENNNNMQFIIRKNNFSINQFSTHGEWLEIQELIVKNRFMIPFNTFNQLIMLCHPKQLEQLAFSKELFFIFKTNIPYENNSIHIFKQYQNVDYPDAIIIFSLPSKMNFTIAFRHLYSNFKVYNENWKHENLIIRSDCLQSVLNDSLKEVFQDSKFIFYNFEKYLSLIPLGDLDISEIITKIKANQMVKKKKKNLYPQ